MESCADTVSTHQIFTVMWEATTENFTFAVRTTEIYILIKPPIITKTDYLKCTPLNSFWYPHLQRRQRQIPSDGEEIYAQSIFPKKLRSIIHLLTSFCTASFHMLCTHQVNKNHAVLYMFLVLKDEIPKLYRANYYHGFNY